MLARAGRPLGRHGWLPYRLGIHDMPIATPRRDDRAATLQRIKAALDPAGILAPGRYVLGAPG